MFDSISSIFNLPTVRRNRYETKPSLKQHISKHHISKTHKKLPNKQPSFDSLIQCLKKPIEQWILLHQAHLKSHIVNRTICEMVIQNSKKGKNQYIQQTRITVHNLFVLMVQYQVMGEFLKVMTSTQLQLLIDGVCGIYLKANNQPIQQLTCVLHHIVTKSRMHQEEKTQQPFAFKPFEIQNVSHFLEVYASQQFKQEEKFYSTAVRVIPMLSELLKVIIKTNQQLNKYLVIKKIDWLETISINLLSFITKDINQITSKQAVSIEFQQVNVQNSQNADLKRKLVEFAKKACKTAGFVSSKELFTYACRQLYFFQHIIKLNKRIFEIANDIQEESLKHQRSVLLFVKLYMQAILNYDVNLPDSYIKSIISIFKLSNFESKSQIIDIGLNVQNTSFVNFIETLESIEAYQQKSRECASQNINFPQFYFQKQQTILSYLLRLVFNLQVQYFQIINIIIEMSHKKLVKLLQYFLIKNGLLHFLVEEQEAILGNDHKMHKVYFKMVSNLLKDNLIISKIFDSILKNALEKHQKSLFTDQIRKNFYLSKNFIASVLADTLTINTNKRYCYYLPCTLQLLLYQQQKSKHDIWISYIHDVILRDLKSSKQKKEKSGKKDEGLQREINEWVTIAIMIQLQYVFFLKGQDIELGEFTMNYLTNILNQAIKWKYEDETQVMRRILKNYEDWEYYYTQVILRNENNQDVIQNELGSTVNFLFLKRWNRKICNSIKLFIQSVITTEVGPESLIF